MHVRGFCAAAWLVRGFVKVGCGGSVAKTSGWYRTRRTRSGTCEGARVPAATCVYIHGLHVRACVGECARVAKPAQAGACGQTHGECAAGVKRLGALGADCYDTRLHRLSLGRMAPKTGDFSSHISLNLRNDSSVTCPCVSICVFLRTCAACGHTCLPMREP